MHTELLTIETDTLAFDGAFYEPDGGATAGAVLLCHGNTMNFYVGAPRFLPPALTALGLRLPFVQSQGPRHPVYPQQPGGRRCCIPDHGRGDCG
jgi:hypothetical protein